MNVTPRPTPEVERQRDEALDRCNKLSSLLDAANLRCARAEKQRDELADVVRKVVCANRLEDHDLILADSALANLKRP